MPWCKKKPIAVQFYDLKETDVDMNGNALTDGKTKDGKYYIKTLESNRHIVDPEIDYVMIGIKGERYAALMHKRASQMRINEFIIL